MRKRHVASIILVSILLIGGIVVGEVAQSSVYMPLNKIKPDSIDKVVTVKGRITNAVSPTSAKAPYSYYIYDGTEVMKVTIWKDVLDAIPNRESLKVGTEIVVKGTVKEFYNRLEIQPAKATDIKTAEAAAKEIKEMPKAATVTEETLPDGTTLTPISTITAAMIDEKVTVAGTITDIKPSWKETAPHTVKIQGEDGGVISIVYWPDVASMLKPDQQPQAGAKIQAKGEVDEHRGNLQVKVGAAEDISVTGVKKIALSADGAVPIKKIDRSIIGQRVTISGTITDVIKVKGGLLLKIKDDTDSIIVPLWDTLGDTLPESVKENIVEDAKITLSGVVFLYKQKQEIEIQIDKPGDIIKVEK